MSSLTGQKIMFRLSGLREGKKDCLFSIKSQKRDTFIPTDSFYDYDLNETWKLRLSMIQLQNFMPYEGIEKAITSKKKTASKLFPYF